MPFFFDLVNMCWPDHTNKYTWINFNLKNDNGIFEFVSYVPALATRNLLCIDHTIIWAAICNGCHVTVLVTILAPVDAVAAGIALALIAKDCVCSWSKCIANRSTERALPLLGFEETSLIVVSLVFCLASPIF